MSCAIEGCTSHTGRKENAQGPLSFHSFPKDEETNQKWLLHARKRNWTWKSHCHVCSIHFTPDSFIPNGKFKWRRLKADAFPTLYLSDTDSLVPSVSYVPEVSRVSLRPRARSLSAVPQRRAGAHAIEQALTSTRCAGVTECSPGFST